MNNELFELCKEVHKRTGWDDRSLQRDYSALKRDNTVDQAPLYTSDYLLEKLPVGTTLEHVRAHMSGEVYWSAFVRGTGNFSNADTPLKALLELVIALDDAGVKL